MNGKNFVSAVEGVDRIIFEWQASARKASLTLIPIVLAELKKDAPVKTGRFRGSIGFRTMSTKTSFKIDFVSTAPYASYILEGTTGGTIIEPQKTMALRFQDQNGDYVFAKSVVRGSTEPNDFAKRVGERLRLVILATFQNSLVFITT